MELRLSLYNKMYLIRKSEEMIKERYIEDKMKTPMHMSMGSEAIVASICENLSNSDQIIATYRSHAAYLAKTGNTDDFFAEMYGKKTALVKGKGGSMHLIAPENGHMGSSAIVASSIPVATGLAYSNKYKNNEKFVVTFFGDGALNEGNFWESINLACLKKLPVVFVCEDNQFAVHTPQSERNGFKSITEIVKNFELDIYEEISTDVEKLYDVSKFAIDLSRKKNRPSFIHFSYYRYLEHVGINYDFDAGYRKKSVYDEWLKNDPILLQRNRLLVNGFSEIEIRKNESDILKKIEISVEKAEKADYPNKDELFKGVYS